MSGPEVLSHLKRICRELDEWGARAGARRAALVLTLPAAGLAGACDDGGPPVVAMYGVMEYAAAFEDCADGVDNDYDDLVDCLDPLCDYQELCIGCDDGYDNDDNGSADCADPTCVGAEACIGSCDDGTDEDGDGLTDCDDPDCTGSPACS